MEKITMRELLQKVIPLDVDLSNYSLRLDGDPYFKDKSSWNYKTRISKHISKLDHELLAYACVGGLGIAAYKKKSSRECGAVMISPSPDTLVAVLKAESENTTAFPAKGKTSFDVQRITIDRFSQLIGSLDFGETSLPEGTSELLHITPNSYVDKLPVVARLLAIEIQQKKRGYWKANTEEVWSFTPIQFKLFKNGNLRIEGGERHTQTYWHGESKKAKEAKKEAIQAHADDKNFLLVSNLKYHFANTLNKVDLKDAGRLIPALLNAETFLEQYPGDLTKEEVWEKFEIQTVVSEL